MKLVEVNRNNCTGCRCCEMVCSLRHERECSSVESRIKILKDDEFGNHLVRMCMQCPEAFCVESCPIEALHKDEKTGAVLVNRKLCNGCEACVIACPLGAISLRKDEDTVFVCDLCGGDPECVKICNRDALLFKDIDPASPARISVRDETSRLLSQMQGAVKPGS